MSGGTCGGEPGDWIPLKEAFSHAHAIEEARLGVARGRGVLLTTPNPAPIWTPTMPDLVKFLKNTRDIIVSNLEHDTDKKKLTLAEIAAGVASRRLMKVFHAGAVPVRANGTGTWNERGEGVQNAQIAIPASFWKSEIHRSGRVLSPIPDYSTGTILDGHWDTTLKFSGRIDRAEVFRPHLIEALGSPEFPEVSGGIFRYTDGAWEVVCGECSTTVPSMKGMGYLAVLLTHPGVCLRWDGLEAAGAAAAQGKAPREWEFDAFFEPDYDLQWQEIWSRKRSREDDLRAVLASLKLLKGTIATASKDSQLRIAADISRFKNEENAARNAANRLDTPWDHKRAQVQHGLTTVLQHLAVLCPAFVRHVGTYQERRLLHPDKRPSGLRYIPQGPDGSLRPVEWDTEPRK